MLVMRLDELRRLIREGGLKVAAEKRKDLTPDIVRKASAAYVDFIDGLNDWLVTRGEAPLEAVGPSGSAAHAEKDIVDRPDTIYGDVDYLVSVPVDYGSDDIGDQRKEDAVAERKYTDLIGEYIRTKRPAGVDVEATLHGTPKQVILTLGSDVLVQVDTVMTHPTYREWMKGRYVPERGIKGYVSGNMYKALGDYLNVNIGIEGVLVRTKDGKRVGGNVRSGVKMQRASNDFNTFLLDIAKHIAPDAVPSRQLAQHPGLDPSNVNIGELAQGIVGLADTLESAGQVDGHNMLVKVLSDFKALMDGAVGRKGSMDVPEEKLAKLRKLNAEQYARVKKIFGV